ncbi:rod-binding protein [Roseibium litorale]|uniref:Rod-binding protein n=1 Tax=Roseibium litorale TaxID=2803841 RepID=A0ABR9CHW0_9HYPH|nr:rod-binding protein [Roseibium litorale]MBD8890422.1 rod-binding protein [Roseibium litorale]
MYDTVTSGSSATPLPSLNNFSKQDKAGAHETAQQFEASFLRNMLEPMFTDMGEGGTWGGGTGSDAWRGMLIDEYANSIAKAGGIGIAGAVERELLAIQENSR